MRIETIELAGLTTRVVVGNGSDIKKTVVLLHGFGAPGDDLVPLAQYLNKPNTRFVFPAAPIELGGLYGDSRAWWHLDLSRLEEDLRTGKPRDRRGEVPEGLADVRRTLTDFLAALSTHPTYNIPNPNTDLVLGGFSQGAMLSLDVALHLDAAARPASLILMSGTLIAEAEWAPLFPTLANVPILQSHGRSDALLPFSVAENLRDALTAAGAQVNFIPFSGGHEIPPPVLQAAAALL